MNNSESKKRLLALQKSEFFSMEIPDTLRFAIEKLSHAEHHDAQIPRPVMPNKPWSQAEENQLVGSPPAGNSIELIATNLSRSTNGVFSRAIGALVALAALPFGLPVDFLKVFSLALDKFLYN